MKPNGKSTFDGTARLERNFEILKKYSKSSDIGNNLVLFFYFTAITEKRSQRSHKITKFCCVLMTFRFEVWPFWLNVNVGSHCDARESMDIRRGGTPLRGSVHKSAPVNNINGDECPSNKTTIYLYGSTVWVNQKDEMVEFGLMISVNSEWLFK